MSYCLNPNCHKHNPDNAKFCQSCGAKLRLKDRYLPMEKLGEGGFGKTFLAVDESNGNQCVIKQLLIQHQSNQKVIELFQGEVNQLSKLGNHPQIPALFDYLEQR